MFNMDFIYLNEKQKFTNQQIFITIKYLLKNDIDPLERFYCISHVIQYITDERLLKYTINLFQNILYLKNETILNRLDNLNKEISIENLQDETKIKAIALSVSLIYSIQLRYLSHLIEKSDLPELELTIDNKKIGHNLSEIAELLKRKLVGFARNYMTSLPTMKEQEIGLRKLIRTLEEEDYDNNSLSFQNEIKHLESIKNNLVPLYDIKSKIEHNHIFSNNGFEMFEHILNEYVKTGKGRLSDIHYFYWAMYNHENKYIHKRPVPFKEWFFKTYNEDLGQIKTFQNVQNPDRDKHFSNALDWFKTRNQ